MDGGCAALRPDSELVRIALRGDKDAFGELITRHWTTAVALATRLLGSADLARDAAQEATITAMTGLDRLRAPDRFGPWFCGITLNVARRWLRQLRAERPAVLPDRTSDDPGPDELAELAELAAAVRAAVAQLADGQRQAVLLFYLQGLTHREVAAELAISVGAVKARLHQARAALTPSLTQLITAPEEPQMTATASSSAWTDVVVTEIRRGDAEDSASRVHVMVLAERDGQRQLPIWVGPAEATALALSLESAETPRPLTYQMIGGILEASGSHVAEVRVTRLAEKIFYAVVVVDGPAGRHEVDARPSDAVNLALVTDAPILVDSALLDDPRARDADHPHWQDLPAGTAELAAEAQQMLRAFPQARP
ncbi:MAG TPA: bifunctional nuclease domain-containing protein [Streptosporangiaceae bacterium]|nr:bifunctional nuclease domain-containing protein [Streptosporangiaceae bacterium]